MLGIDIQPDSHMPHGDQPVEIGTQDVQREHLLVELVNITCLDTFRVVFKNVVNTSETACHPTSESASKFGDTQNLNKHDRHDMVGKDMSPE